MAPSTDGARSAHSDVPATAAHERDQPVVEEVVLIVEPPRRRPGRSPPPCRPRRTTLTVLRAGSTPGSARRRSRWNVDCQRSTARQRRAPSALRSADATVADERSVIVQNRQTLPITGCTAPRERACAPIVRPFAGPSASPCPKPSAAGDSGDSRRRARSTSCLRHAPQPSREPETSCHSRRGISSNSSSGTGPDGARATEEPPDELDVEHPR